MKSFRQLLDSLRGTTRHEPAVSTPAPAPAPAPAPDAEAGPWVVVDLRKQRVLGEYASHDDARTHLQEEANRRAMDRGDIMSLSVETKATVLQWMAEDAAEAAPSPVEPQQAEPRSPAKVTLPVTPSPEGPAKTRDSF